MGEKLLMTLNSQVEREDQDSEVIQSEWEMKEDWVDRYLFCYLFCMILSFQI